MTICKAEGIWFAYRHPQWTLKGISLEVPHGAFLTILGPSGSGKTTLVKVLAGLLKPQIGKVELLDRVIQNHTASVLRRQIGYIPQQLGLVRGLTALENVLLGALGRVQAPWPLLGIFPHSEIDSALEYLTLLGIEHKAHEKVLHLSGGERQRVAIARTLLQRPRIIFADEFVSDLDLPRAAQVLGVMKELVRREGITFVINLHEIPLVHELGEQVIILKEGIVVHQGSAQDISTSFIQEIWNDWRTDS
jgi:phosphonate transport system ATP-binding protein